MEQLFNPLLGEMSVDDLSQRYADTYCSYFGVPKYIHGFMRDDDGTMIMEHAPINIGKGHPSARRDRFRWEGLNVARPLAGWYVVQTGKEGHPFLLTYPVKKQWKRGMGQRNTTIFSPNGRLPLQGFYFNAAITAEENYTNITDEVLATPGSVIPRRDRCLLKSNQGTLDFWYRNQCVAHIYPGKKQIVLLRPQFEQELREVSRSALLDSYHVEHGPFEQEVNKDVVWAPEEEEFEEEGPHDDDWVEAALNVRREHVAWIVVDNRSFEWVSNQVYEAGKKALRDAFDRNRPLPVVSVAATIQFEHWRGMQGRGSLYLHPGKGRTIQTWAIDGKIILSRWQFNIAGNKYSLAWFYTPDPRPDGEVTPNTYLVMEVER